MTVHLAFTRLPTQDAARGGGASAAARALLARLLAVTQGISPLPDMVRAPGGRPCFLDPSLPAFSLSHSRDRIAVALGPTSSLGLDIELPRPRSHLHDMAETLYSAAERNWMAAGPALERFYLLWCVREAVLKSGGHGLGELHRVRVDPFAATLDYPRTPTGQVLAGQHAIGVWALHVGQPATLCEWSADGTPTATAPSVELRLDCRQDRSGAGRLAADQ